MTKKLPFLANMLSILLLFHILLCFTAAYVPPLQPRHTDWVEAELTLRNFPHDGPSPTLSPAQVATACLRSLQFVDYPTESAGLKRIYPFLTWQCLRAITCRDAVTCNDLCNYGALSPTLQPLFGATRIDLHESDCTTIAPTTTRGELKSYPIIVDGAQALAFSHISGIPKHGVSQEPPQKSLLIRMEKARRPPLTDCWLITDIVNTSYAKGGLGWSRHEGV